MGQAYLQWLSLRVRPHGDVAMMLAAYNGGPGWLSRWLAGWDYAHDPLLTLEALPRAESRDYAERVLSHMALCRKRAGQPTPELDALASGKPAIYRSFERSEAR
jgi:soluble lytic murein transglycosylase-like protein